MRTDYKFVDRQRRTQRGVDLIHDGARLRAARDVGLVSDHNQQVARLFETLQRPGRIGVDLQLVHASGRTRYTFGHNGLIEHSVAIQENGLRHFTDSHLVSACLSAGCVTSRCQITA